MRSLENRWLWRLLRALTTLRTDQTTTVVEMVAVIRGNHAAKNVVLPETTVAVTNKVVMEAVVVLVRVIGTVVSVQSVMLVEVTQ